MKGHLYILLGSLLFSACDNKPKTVYFDTEYSSESYSSDEELSNYSFIDTEDIVVPYQEKGGVKIVSVEVNGMHLDMIFDTGCSGTLISIAEANYLYQKGLLNQEDILGVSKSLIADGSIVENAEINLKEVVIAGKIVCSDVRATVSNSLLAPLLLGNEVLDRAASYTIDNVNKTIIFKLK